MKQRDYDYIEKRLLAPATEAMEALERLALNGEDFLANQLRFQLSRFIDGCRDIRVQLMDVGKVEKR